MFREVKNLEARPWSPYRRFGSRGVYKGDLETRESIFMSWKPGNVYRRAKIQSICKDEPKASDSIGKAVYIDELG